LITWIIFGEEYRSLSSSLCFLHSPVTSSLLGPNILLSTLCSIMNIYFCLENRPRAPIMYVNGIQLYKTVEILSMHASAPVFLHPGNFSDFHLSTSTYQCIHSIGRL
jgi:hypothetical protein